MYQIKNQFKLKSIVILFLLVSFVKQVQAQQQIVLPHQLYCDNFKNPLGVDVQTPLLRWNINALSPKLRGVKQYGYQILVASTLELLQANKADVWNSGFVQSNQMQVNYTGKKLLSSRKYFWKVKIWTDKSRFSNWSTIAFWVTGILNANDWKANWVTAAGAEKYAHQYQSAKRDFNLKRDFAEFRANKPKLTDPNFSSILMRKNITVKSKIKQALIHLSGLGQYEITVNGQKIGKEILSPGWSDYTKTVLYDTYDITQQLKTGKNTIGVILSNGMYNIQPDSIRYVKFLNSYGPLKLIASIKIEYTDGNILTVGTDNSWKVLPGPITYSNLFGGEDYDASLEPKGWDTPDFKSVNTWLSAVNCPSPGGNLKGLSSAASPIKAIETLKPVKIVKLKPNIWIYDLGQNTSIMPKIKIRGKKGAFVRIIPSELLYPDGMVDRRSVTQDGVRPAWWQYTIGSKEIESWFPKFFYQGARYLQVELFAAPGDSSLPVLSELSGVVVHSSATAIGNFSSSNELFNRIYSLIKWAQRSNMMSIMTDCPHREKQGWLEQYHLNGPSLRYNFDLLPMFRKSMNDMADSQLQSGLIPNIAPEFFYASSDPNNGFRNSPEWGSSFIIVPWQQYQFSGDISLMRTYFPKMKRYLAFLEESAKNDILYSGLGDWYDIGPKPAWGSQLTPESFTATAIYFYDIQIMGQMAKLLGFQEDERKYVRDAERVRKAFNLKFFDAASHRYATGSNTTYAMPLFLNIAEPSERKILIKQLVQDIRANGNAFTSGEIGFRFLLGTLSAEGYSDVLYEMNNQVEKPGYGYQLKLGATALTEKWDGGVGSFGSQNHFMSGQLSEWFFTGLVGINTDANGPGFTKIIIKPVVVGDLKWVKGNYQTVSGLVSSSWVLKENLFSLDVTIPPNTQATIYIPTAALESVKEGSKLLLVNSNIKFLKYENGYAIYNVLSGSYKFETLLKK